MNFRRESEYPRFCVRRVLFRVWKFLKESQVYHKSRLEYPNLFRTDVSCRDNNWEIHSYPNYKFLVYIRREFYSKHFYKIFITKE